MLKILVRNSRYAPVLICDVCNQLITSVTEGAAVFPNRSPEHAFWPDGQFLNVMHVHKGQCHDTAEVVLGGRAVAGWTELSHHLVFLLGNVSMGEEELSYAMQGAAMLQDMG